MFIIYLVLELKISLLMKVRFWALLILSLLSWNAVSAEGK